MKKILLSLLLLGFAHFALSQTNTSVGSNAGNTGTNNTSVGYYSGRVVTGGYNSFFGSNAGYNVAAGGFNAFMGYRSGYSITSGSRNVFLGAYSGYSNSTGSGNIFIGYRAGFYETTSDKLYIENSDISNPLVYGDFGSNILAVNGSLGIGTKTPQKLLHLDANNTRNGLSIFSGSDGNVFSDIELKTKNQDGFTTGQARDWIISHRKDGYFSGSGNTGTTLEFYAGRMGGGYFAPLVFKSNGDVLLASPNQAISGNVGVGLINPTEKVEVDGSVFINKENSGIIIDGNGKKRVGLMKYSLREAGLWRTNTQDFEIGRVTSATSITEGLGSAPVVDMYFSPSGNIGVGTTTPNSRLAVNGKITAREVEVTADGWADFVFEEDYDLPDLVDIEAHIKEKKHLPGIPSAAEVEENGVNLGAMNTLLLQKIEELTLYIIEQDKQLQELKGAVKSLQTSANK